MLARIYVGNLYKTFIIDARNSTHDQGLPFKLMVMTCYDTKVSTSNHSSEVLLASLSTAQQIPLERRHAEDAEDGRVNCIEAP